MVVLYLKVRHAQAQAWVFTWLNIKLMITGEDLVPEPAGQDEAAAGVRGGEVEVRLRPADAATLRNPALAAARPSLGPSHLPPARAALAGPVLSLSVCDILSRDNNIRIGQKSIVNDINGSHPSDFTLLSHILVDRDTNPCTGSALLLESAAPGWWPPHPPPTISRRKRM